MLWVMRFSGFFSAAILMIVVSPSLQSFPPAEAIRSSHIDDYLQFPGQIPTVDSPNRFSFRKASTFRNAEERSSNNRKKLGKIDVCDPSLVHVAITLDVEYLRGSTVWSENLFLNALNQDVHPLSQRLHRRLYRVDAIFGDSNLHDV